MKVLLQESGIMSNRTIDMAEHAVEMLCSYMPVNILYKYQNYFKKHKKKRGKK